MAWLMSIGQVRRLPLLLMGEVGGVPLLLRGEVRVVPVLGGSGCTRLVWDRVEIHGGDPEYQFPPGVQSGLAGVWKVYYGLEFYLGSIL